eukprot:symbB.v1.2.025501.t2/scaffold2452.1/size150514/2
MVLARAKQACHDEGEVGEVDSTAADKALALIEGAAGELDYLLDNADADPEKKDAAAFTADKDFGARENHYETDVNPLDEVLAEKGSSANETQARKDRDADKKEEEMDELVKGMHDYAAEAREDLVIQWREVCKPRRAGAIAAKARGSRKDFAPLFEKWLSARGLDGYLEPNGYHEGWKIYKYMKEPVVKSDENWETAYHGTWWYSVWLVLQSGVFLESNDRDKGHDFWEPGVYCSPLLQTARWYARPHILFGDGVYHRVLFELRVNTEKRLRNRQRGGVQWVFKPDAVALHAVWERINDWDPNLEARPPHAMEIIEATKNERVADQHGILQFSETESDEPGETEPAEPPWAPHLQYPNSWPTSASSGAIPASGVIPAAPSAAIPAFPFARRLGWRPSFPQNIYAEAAPPPGAGVGAAWNEPIGRQDGRIGMGIPMAPMAPLNGNLGYGSPNWMPIGAAHNKGRSQHRNTPRKRMAMEQPRKRKASEMEKPLNDPNSEEGFEEFLKKMEQERQEKEKAEAAKSEAAKMEELSGLMEVEPVDVSYDVQYDGISKGGEAAALAKLSRLLRQEALPRTKRRERESEATRRSFLSRQTAEDVQPCKGGTGSVAEVESQRSSEKSRATPQSRQERRPKLAASRSYQKIHVSPRREVDEVISADLLDTPRPIEENKTGGQAESKNVSSIFISTPGGGNRRATLPAAAIPCSTGKLRSRTAWKKALAAAQQARATLAQIDAREAPATPPRRRESDAVSAREESCSKTVAPFKSSTVNEATVNEEAAITLELDKLQMLQDQQEKKLQRFLEDSDRLGRSRKLDMARDAAKMALHGTRDTRHEPPATVTPSSPSGPLRATATAGDGDRAGLETSLFDQLLETRQVPLKRPSPRRKGSVLSVAAFLIHRDEQRLKKELEIIRSTTTSSLESVCATAQRGPTYAAVSGETYTEEPLKSQDGLAALALSRRKLAKMEKYIWKKGEPIYETKEVSIDGQREMQRVNTGRREKGQWIPTLEFMEVERKTLVAPTGVCFRQLGAVQGMLRSPNQICLDLGKFQVNELLRCQEESITYQPSEAVSVSVNINSDAPPASRILGHEVRERFLPLGQEMYALGDVAWRFRASVKGMNQGEGGSLAVLQPAKAGPTIFTLGSRSQILQQRESELSSHGTMLYLLGSLGASGQQPQQSQSTPRQRRPFAASTSPRKAGTASEGRSASPKGLARRRDTASRGTQPMSQKAETFRSKSPTATGVRQEKLAQKNIDANDAPMMRRHSDAPVMRRENPFDASKLRVDLPEDKVPLHSLRSKEGVMHEADHDLDSPLQRIARALPAPPLDELELPRLKRLMQLKALQTKCHQRQVSLRQRQESLKHLSERRNRAQQALLPREQGPPTVAGEAPSPATPMPAFFPRTAEMWKAEAAKLSSALQERRTLNDCLRVEVRTLEKAFQSLIELGDQQERNASLRTQQHDAHVECREQHSSYWEVQMHEAASPSAASVESGVEEMQCRAAALHRELGALEAQLLQSRRYADQAQQQAVVMAQQHLQAALKAPSAGSPSPRSTFARWAEADFSVDPEDSEEMEAVGANDLDVSSIHEDSKGFPTNSGPSSMKPGTELDRLPDRNSTPEKALGTMPEMPEMPELPQSPRIAGTMDADSLSDMDGLRCAAGVAVAPVSHDRLQHPIFRQKQDLELHILHCKERLRQRLLKEQIAQHRLKAELRLRRVCRGL